MKRTGQGFTDEDNDDLEEGEIREKKRRSPLHHDGPDRSPERARIRAGRPRAASDNSAHSRQRSRNQPSMPGQGQGRVGQRLQVRGDRPADPVLNLIARVAKSKENWGWAGSQTQAWQHKDTITRILACYTNEEAALKALGRQLAAGEISRAKVDGVFALLLHDVLPALRAQYLPDPENPHNRSPGPVEISSVCTAITRTIQSKCLPPDNPALVAACHTMVALMLRLEACTPPPCAAWLQRLNLLMALDTQLRSTCADVRQLARTQRSQRSEPPTVQHVEAGPWGRVHGWLQEAYDPHKPAPTWPEDVKQALAQLAPGSDKTPPDERAAQYARLADTVQIQGNQAIDQLQGMARDLAARLNGLKATLESRPPVISPSDDGLQRAFHGLIAQLNAGVMARGDPQHIANSFNGLKAALESRPPVIEPIDKGLQQAFGALIARLNAGVMARGDPQHIANSFNGLKAALESRPRVIEPTDKGLQQAFGALIARLNAGVMAQGHPQEIANSFNGLKAALESRPPVIEPTDKGLQQAFGALIARLNAGVMAQGNSQHIANSFNGLKAALESRPPVIEPTDKGLQQAFGALIARLNAGVMAQGNSQHIANSFNGLKAALESRPRVIEPTDKGLQQAFGALIAQLNAGVMARGDPQDIANSFNGLKAALESRPPVIEPTDKGLQQAFGALIARLNAGVMAQGNSQHIANSFNGLKAALESRPPVIEPTDKGLQQAFGALIAQLNAGVMAQGRPQEIANSFNGLKAALESRPPVIEPTDKGLQQAFGALIAQLNAGVMARGRPQEIANSFNGLKAALESRPRVIEPTDKGLQQAFGALIARLNAGVMAQGDPQHIANSFNGLKAALESRPPVIKPTDKGLQQAFGALIAQLNAGVMARGNSQDIANSFNGLKAALESRPRVIEPTDKGLQQAFGALIARLNAGVMARGDPQHIANSFNGLKAALESRPPVIEPTDKGLHQAFGALIARLNAGVMDQGNPQGIANSLNALKWGLRAKTLDAESPGLSEAFERLLQGLTLDSLTEFQLDHVAQIQGSVLAAIDRDVLAVSNDTVLQATPVMWAGQRQAREARRFLVDEPWDLSHAMSQTALLLSRGVGDANSGLVELRDGMQTLCKLQVHGPAFEFYLRLPGALTSLHRRLCARRRSGAGPIDLQPLWDILEMWRAWIDAWPFRHTQTMGLFIHCAAALSALLQNERRCKTRDSKRQAMRSSLEQQLLAWTNRLVEARQAMYKTSAPSLGSVSGSAANKPTDKPTDPAHDDFSVGPLELQLLQRYRPDLEVTPGYTRITAEQQHQLMQQAHQQLGTKPLALALQGGASIDFAVVNARGQLIGHERRSGSIYHEIFGAHAGLPPPVMMKLHMGLKPDELPAIQRVQGHWYRFDVFGGGRLKPSLGDSDPGTLIGIPIEACDFFAQQWLTSMEAYCYAQRAFLPEDALFEPLPQSQPQPQPQPPTSAAKPVTQVAPVVPSARGLKGSFVVALIADGDPSSAQTLFDAKSAWAALRTQDGLGFIRADVVADLKLGAASANNRLPQACPARLSYQALQYYPEPGTVQPPRPQLQAQLVREARVAASIHLTPLINDWTAATLKAKEADARYYAFVHGSPPAYAPTVVPSNGPTLLLPDTPEWRAVGHDGLLVGRNPYDTTNLRAVPAEEIGYSSVLAQCSALQYTLSGYVMDDSKLVQSHFFKGLLIVVPQAQWPKTHGDCGVLLSAKDQKLCSAWKTLDTKKAAQSQDARLALHGCLVIKDQRHQLVGAHYGRLMESLAGDYDGDRLDLVPTAPVKGLVDLIATTPKLDNPKMPKAFTPRTRVGNGQKMMELRLELLQDWVFISALYCAAPLDMRLKIDEALVPDHVLEDVLGQTWWQDLGLPAPPPSTQEAPQTAGDEPPMTAYTLALSPGQRSTILRAEIAIGIKAGTDAEKTTVPVSALKARAREVKTVLREQFKLVSVPYGKGLRRKLQEVYEANDPRDALVQLLEARLSLSTTPQPLRSLPGMLMQEIGMTFLNNLGPHLAGTDLRHTCRILGRVPDLQNANYAVAKLKYIQSALGQPPAPGDMNVRWSHLDDVVAWMVSPSGLTPQALATANALLDRLKNVKLSEGLNEAQLSLSMAEIIAHCFSALSEPAKMPKSIKTLMDRMATDNRCAQLCPLLASLASGNARQWALALANLSGRSGARPYAMSEPPNTHGWTLTECSQTLAGQLILGLGLTGAQGSYRVNVARGQRRFINTLIEQHSLAWKKANLQITVFTEVASD